MAVTYPAAIWPAAMTLAIALAGLQGCTAMAPQYVAQNYAPPYYEGGLQHADAAAEVPA